jgi:hypothetical protein
MRKCCILVSCIQLYTSSYLAESPGASGFGIFFVGKTLTVKLQRINFNTFLSLVGCPNAWSLLTRRTPRSLTPGRIDSQISTSFTRAFLARRWRSQKRRGSTVECCRKSLPIARSGVDELAGSVLACANLLLPCCLSMADMSF